MIANTQAIGKIVTTVDLKTYLRGIGCSYTFDILPAEDCATRILVKYRELSYMRNIYPRKIMGNANAEELLAWELRNIAVRARSLVIDYAKLLEVLPNGRLS